MTTIETILQIAQKCGLAHNGGAGGQYLLCATKEQLEQFATALLSRFPQAVQAESALENCRLYAARYPKLEWAQTILRLCAPAVPSDPKIEGMKP